MFLSQKKNSVLFRFCRFTALQKSIKVFAQADRTFGIGLQNNFKNMVVQINMNVLRIQGIILKTNEAANWQKTMRSQLYLKFIGYSKKKCDLGSSKLALPQ